MLDIIPDSQQIMDLVGPSLHAIWHQLCARIDEKYDMEHVWNHGGKAWVYEYKYRRGGKTLCAFYPRDNYKKNTRIQKALEMVDFPGLSHTND